MSPTNTCRQPVLGIDASRANAAKRTGVEWYAYYLIQELKRVVPPSTRVILYSAQSLRDGLEKMPLNWESRVLCWPPRRLWTQIRLSWEMSRRPPDLLFVPAHVLPIIRPRRSAVTLHDVAFKTLPAAYGRLGAAYHDLATRLAVRHADLILTPSEFSKSELVEQYRARPERIAVTPLGFDESLCRPTAPEKVAVTLDRYALRQPYFLFVGRLERKKNLSGLLTAFLKFREQAPTGADWSLALVGKRGRGFESETKQASLTLNFTPISATAYSLLPTASIRELGYVCPEDMAVIYAGATALVLPSWHEGFGLPILEAFACGTPVIASRTTAIPEVAGDAYLPVDPADVNSLVQAFERLASDTALAGVLAERGRRRLAGFSWSKTAAATWSAMRRVLGPRCE